MSQRIRYGAGGVPYYEQTPEEKDKEALDISMKQSIAAKKERQDKTKKKEEKKVIQEIMGDDLNEQKETLDEII